MKAKAQVLWLAEWVADGAIVQSQGVYQFDTNRAELKDRVNDVYDPATHREEIRYVPFDRRP